MPEMAMRQRMLAVVQGREHDRVPFVQYSNLAGPNEEIWSVVGRENMGLLKWCGAHEFVHPNCRFEERPIERDGRMGLRITMHTPEGSLVREQFREPVYNTFATHKHYVERPEDYKVLLAYLRDVEVRGSADAVAGVIKDLGEDGLPHVSVGRTPYQQLWVQWVSLEELCVHLVECPEIMQEVTEALAEVQRRVLAAAVQAARKLPIPYINFGDNITAPVIGEAYFRKYCLPQYGALDEMLAEAGLDIPIFVHMDGDLKPLWKAIAESAVRGLDSFSPAPDNDTSVADAVRQWPRMRLCLNFPSSVHLAGPEVIYRQAMKLLEEGGRTGRLQIQISENVPPGVWRKSFPQIVKAIHDFGEPGRHPQGPPS